MYVRPKLTFVSFFMFFFLHLPLTHIQLSNMKFEEQLVGAQIQNKHLTPDPTGSTHKKVSGKSLTKKKLIFILINLNSI